MAKSAGEVEDHNVLPFVAEGRRESRSMWSTPLQCTTSASLAAMLEKEQALCYQRRPPNQNVPLAEYSRDRWSLVEWCNKVVSSLDDFRAPTELVQVVSELAMPWRAAHQGA